MIDQQDNEAVLRVLEPREQTVPLVFASPHSGREYPADFVASSRLDPLSLRRSEDSFVEELFACAPRYGAPLLAAMFPRAFCDPNREALELDPSMFQGRLPDHANTRSPRVAAGLGTIARVVASGAEIYDKRIPISEVDRRLNGFYQPYHDKLKELIDRTQKTFGYSVLVDCHSMPKLANDAGVKGVDVVLGDCWGSACAPVITDVAEAAFEAQGYRVIRNIPYAGGYVTRRYGNPRQASHALQIEICRSLYMDEAAHIKHSGFIQLANDLEVVVNALSHIPAAQICPVKAAQ